MDEIVDLLRCIKTNQEKPVPFSLGSTICMVLAAAVGFMIALALNNALVLCFQQIPIGTDGILGACIYAVIALVLGIILLFLIFTYLQPLLQSKMDKKPKPTKCDRL
jgi:uncharacterized BrkB/YihY/UPF0761 family membrane protein